MGKKKGKKRKEQHMDLCDVLKSTGYNLETIEEWVRYENWGNIVNLAHQIIDDNKIKVTKVHTTNNYIRIFAEGENGEQIKIGYKVRLGSDKYKTVAASLLMYSMGKIGGVINNFVRLDGILSTVHRKNHSSEPMKNALKSIDDIVDENNLMGWGLSFLPKPQEVSKIESGEVPRYQQLPPEEKQKIRDYVVKQLYDNPEMTLSEVQEIVTSNFGVTISPTAINNLKERAEKLQRESRNNLLDAIEDRAEVPIGSQEYSLAFPLEGSSGAYKIIEKIDSLEGSGEEAIKTVRIKIDYID
jgi:hypothetical protein